MNQSLPVAVRWNLGVDLWRQGAGLPVCETLAGLCPVVTPDAEVSRQYLATQDELFTLPRAERGKQAPGARELELRNRALNLGEAPASLVKLLARLVRRGEPAALWLEGAAVLYALCPRAGVRLPNPHLPREPWQDAIAGAAYSLTLGSVQSMDQLLPALQQADPTFLRVKAQPDTVLNMAGLAVRVTTTERRPRTEWLLMPTGSGPMAMLPGVCALDWATHLRKTVRLTDLQLQRQLALLEALLPHLPPAPLFEAEADSNRVLPARGPTGDNVLKRTARPKRTSAQQLPSPADKLRPQSWLSVLRA